MSLPCLLLLLPLFSCKHDGWKLSILSMAQVFINQKFIGGGDDTVRLKNSGELQKMLSLQAA
jgi:glutaredoxin-related protein